MSRRTYTRWVCPTCGEDTSSAGVAKVNHQRKHVREGRLDEYVAPDGRAAFLPASSPHPGGRYRRKS